MHFEKNDNIKLKENHFHIRRNEVHSHDFHLKIIQNLYTSHDKIAIFFKEPVSFKVQIAQ